MKITIGQYYPINSVIHNLDSRTKIICTMLFIFAVLLANSIIGYFICAAVLVAVIAVSRVPFKLMLGGLKGIMSIIIFTVLLNLLFTKNGDVLISLGVIKITTVGVYVSVRLCVRLIMLVIGSSVLTLTTPVLALTDGIEYLLSPFKKIGVPAHELAMMMSIAIRFIPTLMEETEKIKKAQMARGADFDTGSIIVRAKAMVPLLVPLFIASFRRADELAMAMEARCYRGDIGRTRMKKLFFGGKDYTAFFIMVVFVGIMIFLRVEPI